MHVTSNGECHLATTGPFLPKRHQLPIIRFVPMMLTLVDPKTGPDDGTTTAILVVASYR